MAIENYTGWPLNVNRIILEATTISIGDSATKSDNLENGQSRSRLKGSFCPDKYSVVMEFNYLQKDSNGKTELQRFYEWHKYQHKYGTIPFEFPQILYSPQSGVKSEDDARNITRNEYYKITSAVEGSKRGEDIQVKMSWENVYSGTVNIAAETNTVNRLEGNRNFIDVIFTVKEEGVSPVTSDFSINEEGEDIEITGSYFDGVNKMRLYYDSSSLSTGGHLLTVTYKSNSYEITVRL